MKPGLTRQDILDIFSEAAGRTVEDIKTQMRDEQEKHKALIADIIAARGSDDDKNKLDKFGQRQGDQASRFMTCLAAAKCDLGRAQTFAEKHFKGDERLIKALGESTLAGGGALVPDDMAGEIIELLRARTVVRRLGAVTVPMPRGQLTFPKFATGASANYEGENTNITKSEPTFEQLQLTARKLTSLVPVSNDLLNDSPQAAATEVRNDMISATGEREDLAFIRGDGTLNTPKGMRNWSKSVVASAGTDILADITTELGELIQVLDDAKVPVLNRAYLFEPRTKRRLLTILDGNGNRAFAEEMAAGTLFGINWDWTQQIPRNLTPGTGTEVYLADYGHLRIGETGEMRIAMAENVTYFDGTQLISGFSQDQTVMRLIQRHDFGPKYLGQEIAIKNEVVWGV